MKVIININVIDQKGITIEGSQIHTELPDDDEAQLDKAQDLLDTIGDAIKEWEDRQ